MTWLGAYWPPPCASAWGSRLTQANSTSSQQIGPAADGARRNCFRNISELLSPNCVGAEAPALRRGAERRQRFPALNGECESNGLAGLADFIAAANRRVRGWAAVSQRDRL